MCLLCRSVGGPERAGDAPVERATRGKKPRERHSNCGPYGALDVQPLLYLLFAFKQIKRTVCSGNAKPVSAHSVNSYSGAQCGA